MPEHTPAPTFSRAVYGFVLYLTVQSAFIMYIIWALVPETFLKQMNITYFPQKYWAIAIPILLLNYLALFVFCIYPSINYCLTPNIYDLKTISSATVSTLKSKSNNIVQNDEVDLHSYKTNEYSDLILHSSKLQNGYKNIKTKRKNNVKHDIYKATSENIINLDKKVFQVKAQKSIYTQFSNINEGKEKVVEKLDNILIIGDTKKDRFCECEPANCYKVKYDIHEELLKAKNIKNKYSVPPVTLLNISDVCKHIYLKKSV